VLLFITVMHILPAVESDVVHPSARSASIAPADSAASAHTDQLGAFPLPPNARDATDRDPLAPILVADDDEDDTFFIERLIKKTGVRNPIRTFSDGTEVVNFIGGAKLATPAGRLRCPRLLFLDLKMRGLGGFGFLEWARRRKDLSLLTIVVLSNSNESETVAKALALGAHRYLVKYPCAQTINTIVRSVYPLKVF
jgi:CheY-like chemotaxis protein